MEEYCFLGNATILSAVEPIVLWRCFGKPHCEHLETAIQSGSLPHSILRSEKINWDKVI